MSPEGFQILPIHYLLGQTIEITGFRDLPEHGFHWDLGYCRSQQNDRLYFGNIQIADEATKEALAHCKDKSDGSHFLVSEGALSTIPRLTYVR